MSLYPSIVMKLKIMIYKSCNLVLSLTFQKILGKFKKDEYVERLKIFESGAFSIYPKWNLKFPSYLQDYIKGNF